MTGDERKQCRMSQTSVSLHEFVTELESEYDLGYSEEIDRVARSLADVQD